MSDEKPCSIQEMIKRRQKRNHLFETTGFDNRGFDRHGFDKYGIHEKTNTLFDPIGFDKEGYNRRGYNRDGIHKETNTFFNPSGFDWKGYDKKGYDCDGYGKDGFNAKGFDVAGYGRDGYNMGGYNREGYGKNGYNQLGYDRHGYNCNGYDRSGFDKNGYDRKGFNFRGNHKDTGIQFDPEGYDQKGYDKNKRDRNGNISPSEWREIIDKITDIPLHKTSWAIDKYPILDKQDRELAHSWTKSEKTDDFTKARMLSARMAEKIAADSYRNLGFNVEDISLTQISTEKNECSNDWKLYDLLLDNRICIDVKNARTSLNSNVNYVEHCVSRFKQNRKNENITISGVLSPYLQLNEFENQASGYSYYRTGRKIFFLGETSITELLKLENRFTNRFLKVSLGGMNFIPRYFFEFPEKFYNQRNENCDQLRRVSLAKTPSLQECDFNPIPAYIASGLDLPDIWFDNLMDWQRDFYNHIKLNDTKIVTMPILFLTLLTHFLEALTRTSLGEEYSPSFYRQLIYSSNDDHHQMPLGIYDPLKTIDDFIKTLSTLWRHRKTAKLDEFELFKFNGVGLLQGKRFNHNRYETILAYCGGFVSGMGKCGNSPLIIGEHDSCTECGKLICNICGYCSSDLYCSKCEGRMQEKLEEEVSFSREETDIDDGPPVDF